MDNQQLDELFERYAQQFSDIALSVAYGIRVPMGRTPMRALAVSLKELDGDGRAMVSDRLARMVSDLVPLLEKVPEGTSAEELSPVQRYREDRGLSSVESAQRALDIVENFDYGVRQRRFGRYVKEDLVTLPSLASRNPDETYLLYAGGDDRFRPQTLTLNQGTEVGGNDLSGMTLEEAFSNVIRPAAENAAARNGLADPAAVEEYVYKNGYRPLWSLWAKQNMSMMKELRSHLFDNAGAPAVSMTRVRRLVDPAATSRLSPARVLQDILDRGPALYAAEEVKAMFAAPVQLQADPRLEEAGIGEYDIYTVGMGGLSERDFWRLVPADTDVMVVFTGGKNDSNKHFNHGHFTKVAGNRGIASVDWPIRDDGTKAAAMKMRGSAKYVEDRFYVKQDGIAYIDYGALSEDPGFQETVENTVLRYAREGKKVCVVGSGPSAAKGEYGAWRGLLFGQYVETHTPFRIAHIDAGYDGRGLRVFSQEEICRKALPPRSVIENGTTKDMRFLNPVGNGRQAPKALLPPGVSIRRKVLPGDDPELRMIEGHLNYGTDVEFRHVEAAAAHVAGKGMFYDSVKENVAHANFTVVFAASGEGSDKNVAEVMEMAPPNDTYKVMIPETADACYDPDVADRAARTLSGHLMRSVAFQYARFGRDKVDLDNVKVYVTGSSEARIANQQSTVITNGDESDGIPESQKLEMPLGPSQEDVNHFVTEVFRRAFVDRPKTLAVDGEKLPFTIGEIHSHFDSGAGEAGIIAAQHLAYMQRMAGIPPFRPVVISTNSAVTTVKDDSQYGKVIDDPAYFRNRAHRGFLPDVVDEMLIEQVRDIEARRSAAEDGMQVGLTDRQVMLLYELGIDNGTMIEAIDMAVKNDVSVNSEQDMVDFLDLCRSNGLDIADGITADVVAAAYDRVLENEERWRDAGISYVTAAGPLYPPSLESFKEYTETRTRPVMHAADDGSVQVSSELDEYTVRRPAILWCRGDISLLQEPSVGIIGGQGTHSVRDARAERLSAALRVLSAVPDDLLRTAAERIPREHMFLASDADALVAGHESAKVLRAVVTEYGEVIRLVAAARPEGSLLQAMKDMRDTMADTRAAVPGDLLRTAAERIPRDRPFLASDADALVAGHDVTKALHAVVTEHGDTLRRVAAAHPEGSLLQAMKDMRDAARDQEEKVLLDDAVRMIEVPVDAASVLRDAPKKVVVTDDAMRAALAMHDNPAEFTVEEAERLLSARLYRAMSEQSAKVLLDDAVRMMEVPVSAASVRGDAPKKAVVTDDALRAALAMPGSPAEFTVEDAEELLSARLYRAMSEYDDVVRRALRQTPGAPVVDTVDRLRNDLDAAAANAEVVTSNTEKSLVREFCSSVAQSDLPVVASIDDAVSKDGVFDTLAMRNGRVVAVTDRPFQYEAEGAVQRLHDLGERIATLNEAVVSANAVSEESLRAALALHPDAGDVSLVEAEQVAKDAAEARLLFFAMSQYTPLMREAVAAYPTETVPRALERLRDDAQAERHLLKSDAGVADVAEEVVRKGGIVVSDKEPAAMDAPKRSMSQRIVAGIASAAAVFDQIHHAQPMGLMSMALYAAAGLTYITLRPTEKVVGWLRDRHAEREQVLEEQWRSGAMSLHEAQGEIDADAAATETLASSVVTVTGDGRSTAAALSAGDAGKMAVDQAYAEHEDMMRRRDALETESVSPDGARRTIYSRVKESISSVFGLDFDDMFRDPKEARAKEKDREEAPSEERHLSQMEIEVLSYRGNRFFFVPDGQPHIAAAVRERYGEDAKVLDPSLKVKVRESLDLGRIDGQDRFREPEGTQLLPHRSYIYKVYYNDGVVHGVNTLPSGVMGLPPQPARKKAAVAWKHFMDSMKDLQCTWLLQAGLPPQAGTAQLRCENADYMVFSPNRIEVRRGDDLRCFVEFRDGVIRACNLEIPDLSEYHETKAYDILPLRRSGHAEVIQPEALYPSGQQAKSGGRTPGEGASPGDVARGFGDYIREALFDRPVSEQEAMKEMQSTREKKEEMDEQIESGHLRIREDNMSIACDDVARAMHAGRIPNLASFTARDVVAVYAAALRAEEQARATVRSCDRQKAMIGKEMEAVEKALENDGMDVAKADAERDALGEKLERIYAMRRKGLVEIANMEDVKASLREGMYPYGLGGKVVLDGVVFSMRNVRPSEEQMLAAERELRAAGVHLDDVARAEVRQEEPGEKQAPQEPREEMVQEITEVEVVKEAPQEAPAEELSPKERLAQMDAEIAATMDRDPEAAETESFCALLAERDALAREVRREDVVPESERNGICIVNTPEGQRYCNAGTMEFISEAYPKLNRMGQTVGIASAVIDGKEAIKILRRDGRELSPLWFEKLAKTKEDSILVATALDQTKHVINREYGIVAAGPLRAVQDYREGRARVQGADGRYNYIDESGKLMQQSMWFDDASHFVNGRARVRLESPAETKYMVIDRDFHNMETRVVTKENHGARQKHAAPKPAEKENKSGFTPGHPGK